MENVAILIPIHNRPDLVSRIVGDLLLRYPQSILVLVDDSSNIETKELLKTIELNNSNVTILINEKQSLFTRTVNKGLRYINSKDCIEYVWVLNSDCLLEETPLESLVEAIKSDSKLKLVGYSNSPRNELDLLTYVPDLPHFVTGHSWLIDFTVFKEVGYLDETDLGGKNTRYPEFAGLKGLAHIGSDREFCDRLRSYGHSIAYVNRFGLQHHAGQSWNHDLGWLSQFNISHFDKGSLW